MSRRSAEQLRNDGAAAERTATVAHLRMRANEIGQSARLAANERSLLRRRLDGFADEIAEGFHR